MKKILLILVLTPFLFVGCTVADIRVGCFESEHEVTMPEPSGGIEAAALTPWQTGAELLTALFSFIPKVWARAEVKAMEEKVNYKKSRSFSIFRLTNAVSKPESPDE